MSIWSRKITEAAAFWGMLAGLVFNVGPKFLEFIGVATFPSYLNPVIIGTPVSLVVTILVSRRTTVTGAEATSLAKLHRTPADEIDTGKTRTTLFAPGVLILYGILMPVLLITYYVRPFQRATGTLAADGGLNWFTGEALLAMSWAMIYISLGVFAARVIRSGYSPVSDREPQPGEQ